MKYAFMSDKGITRDNNEDFILISEKPPVFLLADGMGGHSAGEIASENACRFVMEKIYENKDKLEKDYIEIFENAIKQSNEHLLKMSEKDSELEGMGTTLVLLYLVDDKYTIFHIGDSRAYKFSGKKLIKLTKDHSLVQDMVDDGIISEKEAKNHKLRNVITRSLGAPQEVEIDFVEGNLKEGELLLLCSDGLHDYVDLNRVISLLKKHGVDAVEHIIDLANKAGGKDNCSVICVST